LAFPPFDVRGQILISTKGPACKLCYSELVLSSLPKFSSVHTAKALLDPPLLILRKMPNMLRSASALAALWQCQQCNCINHSKKNKRRCFSCRAWRDGVLRRGRATSASVTLYGTIWYYFKMPPPLPPLPMPLLVSPAIIVCRPLPIIRRLSSAACFHCKICRPI
jgi:hypothetical protein